MQMSATLMTMTYSFALANYRNTVNKRFPNEYTVKINSRRIQIHIIVVVEAEGAAVAIKVVVDGAAVVAEAGLQ